MKHATLLVLLSTALVASSCLCSGEEPDDSKEEIATTREIMKRAVERGDYTGARMRLHRLKKLGARVDSSLQTKIEQGAKEEGEARAQARELEQQTWLSELKAELAKGDDANLETAQALAKSLKERDIALEDETAASLKQLIERDRERRQKLEREQALQRKKSLHIVDLPALAKRTPRQVRKLLGKPKSCGRLKVEKGVMLSFDHCIYELSSSRSIQVDYILNKAAFFEVFGVRAAPSTSMLERLGFKSTTPSNTTKISHSWFGHQGFNSIILIRFKPAGNLQIQADRINRSRIANDQGYRKSVIRGSRKPR